MASLSQWNVNYRYAPYLLPLALILLALSPPALAETVEEFYRGKTINGLIVRRDGELLFVAYDGQV